MRRTISDIKSKFLEENSPDLLKQLNSVLQEIENALGSLDYNSDGNVVSINSSMKNEGYWIVSGGYPVHVVNINGTIGKKIYED